MARRCRAWYASSHTVAADEPFPASDPALRQGDADPGRRHIRRQQQLSSIYLVKKRWKMLVRARGRVFTGDRL